MTGPLPSARPSAAFYYVPDEFSIDRPVLMGIHAASHGMVEAMARYGGAPTLYALTEQASAAAHFRAKVRAVNPGLETAWIPTHQPAGLAAPGTLVLPGPGLGGFAWTRRSVTPTGYSLCGITHTTATPLVMDAIAEFLTAPVEPWDALVCTSPAVHRMVRRILDDQIAYLADRFPGARLPPLPALPVIPLGVETRAFARNLSARPDWRAQWQIAEDAVVLGFLGRLSFSTKAHPIPLFQALALAQRQTRAPLHLVLAGWFTEPAVQAAYIAAARTYAPEVRVSLVDGRTADNRQRLWSVADLFIAAVDNVQETFGLAPVEAMAAGLPVILSDWDGYRSLIEDGVEGIRVPTVMPPAGGGEDLARRLGARTDGYETYLAGVGQAIVIDPGRLAEAISTLADDPARRAAMGAAGRARAQSRFDWRQVIAQYQDLWTELGRLRGEAAPRAPRPWPARPDPFHAFDAYPTRALAQSMMVAPGPTDPAQIALIYANPMVACVQPALAAESDLARLLAATIAGPRPIGELLALMPPMRRAVAWRAVAWLLKYGFLTLLT